MNKIFYLLTILLIVSGSAFAQKRTITGKVTDGKSPLQGVNILAGGQKGGATTTADGSYSITVNKDVSNLIFSYVGFKGQTITIGEQKTINVTLESNATTGDEVVVIGYGTQKRSQVTGAVSKYSNDDIDEAPVSRLDQALQGKIAGVQFQNYSSEAGSDVKVQVRGISSVNAVSDPLVVVDGHPVADGLAFVNMADVQSVEVLKDAASAAIYGSRGANGVILVTTKSGKAEKTRYTVKLSTGVKKAYELYPLLTTTAYTNLLYYEASLRAKDPSVNPQPAILNSNERAAYIIENQLRGGVGTDWQKEAIRDAIVQNVQINASGGSKTLRYYISGGYNKDEGAMYHSNYDKYNVRAKLDADLGKRVKLSFNVNPSYISRERPSTTFTDFWRFQSYLPVYLDATTAAFVNQNPLYANLKPGDFSQARYFNGRVYTGLMPDGTFYSTTTPAGPFSTANNTPKAVLETRTIKTNDYRVLTSGDITVNILPGLNFKSLASVYAVYNTGLDFAQRNSNRDGDINKGVFTSNLFIDLLSENTLTYNKKIGKNSFDLLAGYTAQKTKINNSQSTGTDFPSDNIRTLNTANVIVAPETFTLKDQIGLLSYLGRVAYAYDNKYLLSASFRTDGSSYFAPGKKYGNFPAASIGWVASQESFIKKIKLINNLKFRLSYGAVGNNRIDAASFIPLIYPAPYDFGGSTGTVNPGQSLSKLTGSNPDLQWETTYSFNAGLDMSILKNMINFSLDVYQGKTSDGPHSLLLKQSAQPFSGVQEFYNNIGRLQNDGIEFQINTNNVRTRAFRWSTNGNISHTKNKILSFGQVGSQISQGERTEGYLTKVGGPIVQYFGYKTDGVWLSQAQIDAAKADGLTSSLSNVFVPGGLKLVDVNHDNVINTDDRVVTGNPYPDFTWGITNSFTYKNFDLSVLVQGSQGGKLINGDANYNETKRYNENYIKGRWISPMFPGDGKTPYSTFGFNWLLTDYAVEDASYYAIREVIFGATVPKALTDKIKFNTVRFYFSAQNLYFHSAKGYRGINPEARSKSSQYASPLLDGYQRGGFPIPRSFLLGVDINF